MLTAKWWRMAIAVAVSVVLAGGVALALPGESNPTTEILTGETAPEQAEQPEQTKVITQAMRDKDKVGEIIASQLNDSQYGGVYVDEQGKAHIMLSDREAASLFDGLEVVLHFCLYSINDLDLVHRKVEAKWPKELTFGGTWIVTKENVLGVGMRITREEGEQWLKDHPEVDMSWTEDLPLKLYYAGEPGNWGEGTFIPA